MSLPELIVFSNRQQAASAARDILAGRLGVVEGSRLLVSLSHRVGVADFDADFLPFVGINSETDHLPIGEVRRHWAADALARKDVELAAAEAQYRALAFEACSSPSRVRRPEAPNRHVRLLHPRHLTTRSSEQAPAVGPGSEFHA